MVKFWQTKKSGFYNRNYDVRLPLSCVDHELISIVTAHNCMNIYDIVYINWVICNVSESSKYNEDQQTYN